MKPDISVDSFKIDEDGCVWTAAAKLPDGFRPGDHLVLGDGRGRRAGCGPCR